MFDRASFGDAWLVRCFSAEKVAATQTGLERYGGRLIFFLRLNPITSSDLVSYAAGLTRIPVTTVMLATGLGMAPLCFAQAYFAESMLQAFPKLIYLLTALCIVYFLFVIAAIRGMVLLKSRRPWRAAQNPLVQNEFPLLGSDDSDRE